MIGGRRAIDDRAVSETLGYVLVFAVVVATIAAVSTIGIGGLQDRQQAEQFTNVQRAFDVLAENLDDINRHGDPSRATEIRLAGGSLEFGDPVNVTVGVHNGTEFHENRTFQVTPIRYVQDDETIVYEGGALFRTRGDSGVVLREPAFVNGSNRTVLPLTQTYTNPESAGIGGRGTVLVVGQRGPRITPITYEPDAGEAVRVELEYVDSTARADVWARYFNESDLFEDSAELTDSTVAANVSRPGPEPDGVSVSVTMVRVRLSR